MEKRLVSLQRYLVYLRTTHFARTAKEIALWSSAAAVLSGHGIVGRKKMGICPQKDLFACLAIKRYLRGFIRGS